MTSVDNCDGLSDGLRVWIGMNEARARLGLDQCLAKHGIRCNTFATLDELIGDAELEKPGVILLDHDFSGRPGMTAGFEILARPDWAAISIVFMLPRGVPVEYPDSYAKFDVQWIRKPFSCEWIVQHVHRIAKTNQRAYSTRKAAIDRIEAGEINCQNYVAIGQAWEMSCSTVDAMEAYRKAIQIDSQCAEAYYHLGRQLYNDGNYAESINALQAAVNANPRFAMAFDKLGVVLRAAGDVDGAMAAWRSAMLHGDTDLQKTVRSRMRQSLP